MDGTFDAIKSPPQNSVRFWGAYKRLLAWVATEGLTDEFNSYCMDIYGDDHIYCVSELAGCLYWFAREKGGIEL